DDLLVEAAGRPAGADPCDPVPLDEDRRRPPAMDRAAQEQPAHGSSRARPRSPPTAVSRALAAPAASPVFSISTASLPLPPAARPRGEPGEQVSATVKQPVARACASAARVKGVSPLALTPTTASS